LYGGLGGAVREPEFCAALATLKYGVGLRVRRDTALLRQIREEVVHGGMQLEQIASLENVSVEELIDLLDERLAGDVNSGWRLRAVAASRAGWQVVAWRNSRGHASRLHVVNEASTTLCGTPPGADLIAVYSGPCMTCLELAGAPRPAYRDGPLVPGLAAVRVDRRRARRRSDGARVEQNSEHLAGYAIH
jgi:hypothetical protein